MPVHNILCILIECKPLEQELQLSRNDLACQSTEGEYASNLYEINLLKVGTTKLNYGKAEGRRKVEIHVP